MKTYFAPPERSDRKTVNLEVNAVYNSPIVEGILKSANGLLAILNDKRQILAANFAILRRLEIDNPEDILGLRPGEILNCKYSNLEEGGCGTSKFCSNCGAAIAIVSSLGENKVVERNCSLAVKKNSQESDLFLTVRSCPIEIDEKKYLLLFIHDITRQKKLIDLEQAFFMI